MDRFTAWKAAERFFVEFFGFLFDNISACYLVFASFFPYSCALILLFVVHVYAQETKVVIGLLRLIYSYSTLK